MATAGDRWPSQNSKITTRTNNDLRSFQNSTTHADQPGQELLNSTKSNYTKEHFSIAPKDSI